MIILRESTQAIRSTLSRSSLKCIPKNSLPRSQCRTPHRRRCPGAPSVPGTPRVTNASVTGTPSVTGTEYITPTYVGRRNYGVANLRYHETRSITDSVLGLLRGELEQIISTQEADLRDARYRLKRDEEHLKDLGKLKQQIHARLAEFEETDGASEPRSGFMDREHDIRSENERSDNESHRHYGSVRRLKKPLGERVKEMLANYLSHRSPFFVKDKAEIIQRRKDENDDEPQFYVHYCGYDRRLDEWVPGDRISAVPVVEDAAAVEPAVLTPPPLTSASAEEGKELDKRRSRRIAKRKRDDVESEDMVSMINDSMYRPSSQSAISFPAPLPPPPPSSPPEPRRLSTRRRASSSAPTLAPISTATAAATRLPPPPASAVATTPTVLTPIDILEKEREQATKVRNVGSIVFGKYEIATWYYSPYPDEYGDAVDKLWICEFCMKYMKEEMGLRVHRVRIKSTNKAVSQCGSESYFEFLRDREATHSYLRKFASSRADNCIVRTSVFWRSSSWIIRLSTMTSKVFCSIFSRKKTSGRGLWITWSGIFQKYASTNLRYELSKRQHTIGSPEKPLSDLGLLGYQSYWASVLLSILRTTPREGTVSIRELSRATSIREEDIISTLSRLGLLRYWSREIDGEEEGGREAQEGGDNEMEGEEGSEEQEQEQQQHLNLRQAHHPHQEQHQLQPPAGAQLPGNRPRGRQPICVTMAMVEKAIAEKKIQLGSMVDPERIVWVAPSAIVS
ncbi:hypothetical protein BC937DRAFT_88003 [Endogone sp. FLAS-F59071]|nr:hypothetical protein BC937DRAFT_88003 [Endogone sp. FLAS-F59071]|eukprot:RUS22668.1 hypothetical protein BC937DRAFT_88003 [Endogone sp. FLAS-F59071]